MRVPIGTKHTHLLVAASGQDPGQMGAGSVHALSAISQNGCQLFLGHFDDAARRDGDLSASDQSPVTAALGHLHPRHLFASSIT